MRNLKSYGTIVLLMSVSFFLSGFVSTHLFVDNSPVVNPVVARLFRIDNAKYIKEMLASKLEDIPLTPVGQGAYAKNKENYSYKEMHFNEITWKEYTYHVTIDGALREIKIKIPSDQTPPSDAEVQNINE